MNRTRIHTLALDLHEWEADGSDYRVTLTIDESKLADSIGRAIGRHDGRTELANGGIVIQATKVIGKPTDKLFGEPT